MIYVRDINYDGWLYSVYFVDNKWYMRDNKSPRWFVFSYEFQELFGCVIDISKLSELKKPLICDVFHYTVPKYMMDNLKLVLDEFCNKLILELC